MAYKAATRKAVPMLISLAGTSGSGKTYSALLLAAGIAGNGKVGFIDTENGRGSMYADSPGIVKALPNGYLIDELSGAFPPEAYIAKIKEAEAAGVNVLVIDSGSHEWEGIGGCQDIAENNKLRGMPNWAKAKRAHKAFINYLLSTPMHIIMCLRARDKVKIVKAIDPKTGREREEIIPIGVQPIAEKNFVFEMLLSLQLDEATHFARAIKCPEPLAPLFQGERLLTKADGERIREWNERAAAIDPIEFLKKRARAAAEDGEHAYREFFTALDARQKKILAECGAHDENKAIATEGDAARAQEAEAEMNAG